MNSKYTERILRNAQALLDRQKVGSMESLKGFARQMKLDYCELSRKLSKKRSNMINKPKTMAEKLARKLAYADQMQKLVPYCDHITVQYALAVAAKYFGLYSPKTATCDVCNSLWGKCLDHCDATQGHQVTAEEKMFSHLQNKEPQCTNPK